MVEFYLCEENIKANGISLNEFHVSKEIREKCDFDGSLFASTGNVILANFKNVRLFAKKINDMIEKESTDIISAGKKMVKAGQLNAMGLIDEIFHHVCARFRRDALQALLLRVVRLRDCGIELVRARRVVPFELIVNVRGGIEYLFQAIRPNERGGAVHFIEIAHFRRDFDVLRRIVHFLTGKLRAKYTRKLFRRHRL